MSLLLIFYLHVSLILLLLPFYHPLNQWNIDIQFIFTLKRVLNEELNCTGMNTFQSLFILDISLKSEHK